MSVDGPKSPDIDGKSAHQRGGSGGRLYHGAIVVLSLVFVAIGLAVLVVTLAAGGGPASVGFLLGIVFILVGGGRLWLASRMRG